MKILLFNFNNILTEVEEELKARGHTILAHDGTEETMKEADCMVTWNETGLGGFKEVVQHMKDLGKKVVLVQHGRRGTSRIYPPFNEKLISDIVCVWSENDRQRLISCGVDESKIHVTGTSIWKHLKPRVSHETVNVVYSPEHWDIDVTENFIVADELRKLKGVNVITKILEGHQDPSFYDNPVSSNRNSKEHFEIVADTLSKADVVVAISESTFELLAEALDIPVVVADCWIPKSCDGDDRYKEYHREYSDACELAPLSKLNDTIRKHLKHPELLREKRKQIVIDDGGFDIADPVGKIVDIIERL